MEYSNLYDMITCLEYGTNLKIGVLFFGGYGNEMLRLPFEKTIHSGAVCEMIKTNPHEFPRCLRCKNAAVKWVMHRKTALGGVCVNGIYEYTKPVIIKGDVAAVIFIGNILCDMGGQRLLQKLKGNQQLLKTLEKDFDKVKCEKIALLIESYIKMLLENYTECKSFNPVIDNIKNYIDANIEFDIKILELASIFHYNEKYLGRLFKRETGYSFSEYINLRRIKIAGDLILNSNEAITGIAGRVGFNNTTYFNRVFKKLIGLTPSEYRKNKKAS